MIETIESFLSLFLNLFSNSLAALSDGFNTVHATLFENMVLPTLRMLELSAFTGEAFNGTELFLLGVLQIAFMVAVLRPLEIWRPAEPFENKMGRRTDIVYTLLHRLGFFALISFAVLTPLLDEAESQLRLFGWGRLHLDQWAWLAQSPVLLFASYFVVLDALGYGTHRLQHRLNWWWQLHALHHANRHMSLWSDNRNHLLDDVILDVITAVAAWFVGVEPAQFVMLTIASRLLQSLQHANVRLPFGYLGERLLVSPQFHRVHHSVDSGFEGKAYGCNFGVLLPWWDILFGTANFTTAVTATGVRDQIGQGGARHYGDGFWAQQKLGFLRLLGKS